MRHTMSLTAFAWTRAAAMLVSALVCAGCETARITEPATPAPSAAASVPIARPAPAPPLTAVPSERAPSVADAASPEGTPFEGFASAVLFMPQEGSAHGPAADLAPLIVEQVRDGSTPPAMDGFFGAIVLGKGNSFDVDTSRPTVVVDLREVQHDGQTYRQLLYGWFYSWTPARVHAQAVVMTLAPDGFPCVWEVGTPPQGGGRTLYVSRSFEARCVERFGGPLPARRFAAERALSDAPDTQVAGLIEDGPIPIGPYLYLQADTHDVATVTCRCRPSLVESFVDSRSYQLEPKHSDGFEWHTVEANQWPWGDPWNLLRWPYEPQADSTPREPHVDED